MIQYFLCTTFILCVVESQAHTVTVEELVKLSRNQTFNEPTNDNSTMKLNKTTFSLHKDETLHDNIEIELQSNHTSGFFSEDNEHFQDQETLVRHCNHSLLILFSHNYCGELFQREMLAISTDNWCVLEKVIRPYNDLTVCLENVAPLVGCYFPNPSIQDFFVYIHSSYFQNCSNADLLLEDAPHGVVVALTLLSVIFIPFLVYLVACKSSV